MPKPHSPFPENPSSDRHAALTWQCGNITALIGDDGTLLVDAEFAPFVPEILKKLKTLGGDAPKFVVNTHYHEDHTGGNAAMHAAGATVIAQARVRARSNRSNGRPSAVH